MPWRINQKGYLKIDANESCSLTWGKLEKRPNWETTNKDIVGRWIKLN